MNYTFQGSGKISFFGFPVVKVRKLYPSKFSEGEIVYSLRKARKGIYEKIAIKKVILRFKSGQPIFLYKDTFNTLYNENDLCRNTEAQQEVESYKEYLEGLISIGYVETFESYACSPFVTYNKIIYTINKAQNNNFKTIYFDSTVDAKDLVQGLNSILLDGGSLSN